MKQHQYYLIGRHLSHSYSPDIHAHLGSYDYRLKELEPNEIESFLSRKAFDGLNVTIPYKQDVIPHLDTLTDRAQTIGAVNTIRKTSDGQLVGDNTDPDGFLFLLQKLFPNTAILAGNNALILGAGGASKTVQYVLSSLGMIPFVMTRQDIEQNRIPVDDIFLLINATPVGMYPHPYESPLDIGKLRHLHGVVDLTYNPHITCLMHQAKQLLIPVIGGLPMLVEQACRSALFWGESIHQKALNGNMTDTIVSTIMQKEENVVLIGMPGCGKTTIGRLLADILGKEFVDTDALFASRWGDIPTYFEKYGEDSFREKESLLLREVSKEHGQVIATGGGCVTRQENEATLKQNGTVIWLNRPLDQLPLDNRPLSNRKGAPILWEERAPLYRQWSDYKTDNCTTPNVTADAIVTWLSKRK